MAKYLVTIEGLSDPVEVEARDVMCREDWVTFGDGNQSYNCKAAFPTARVLSVTRVSAEV